MHENDNEERLAEIETLLAFQEQTIEDLSQVIRSQQAEIDELKQRFDLLIKLRQAESASAS